MTNKDFDSKILLNHLKIICPTKAYKSLIEINFNKGFAFEP